MIEKDEIANDMVSSYGIECVIYNVPSKMFIFDSKIYTLKEITFSIADYLCHNFYMFEFFKETNDILYIFNNIKNIKDNYMLFFKKVKKYLEEIYD